MEIVNSNDSYYCVQGTAVSEQFSKMTRQRRVILDTLKGMCSHPDAMGVYEAVRLELPSISLATVYRNLEVLYRAGLIGRMETAGSRMRFDALPEEHCHVLCDRCGQVRDVNAGGAAKVNKEYIRKATGYKVTGQKIEFTGICPDCARKQGTAR